MPIFYEVWRYGYIGDTGGAFPKLVHRTISFTLAARMLGILTMEYPYRYYRMNLHTAGPY